MGPEMRYFATRTKSGNRKVALRLATTELLRYYLSVHPHAGEPTATGEPDDRGAKHVAQRQADALADLTVAEAEQRLVFDWAAPGPAGFHFPGGSSMSLGFRCFA
jgi:hypothetical protein